MSQPSLPQPPPGNNRSDTEPVCGRKFRQMLRCVESTGAVNACSEQVKDFLACERTVFRAAVSARQSGPTGQPQIPASPQQHPFPNLPPELPPPVEMHFQPSEQSLLVRILSATQRAVNKQVGACSMLVDTIRRPAYHTQLLDFGQRMVSDMGVTVSVMKKKTMEVIHSFASADKPDDKDSNKPRA